jgi:hypothetical protein
MWIDTQQNTYTSISQYNYANIRTANLLKDQPRRKLQKGFTDESQCKRREREVDGK